jgi:hypothetical protein
MVTVGKGMIDDSFLGVGLGAETPCIEVRQLGDASTLAQVVVCVAQRHCADGGARGLLQIVSELRDLKPPLSNSSSSSTVSATTRPPFSISGRTSRPLDVSLNLANGADVAGGYRVTVISRSSFLVGPRCLGVEEAWRPDIVYYPAAEDAWRELLSKASHRHRDGASPR